MICKCAGRLETRFVLDAANSFNIMEKKSCESVLPDCENFLFKIFPYKHFLLYVRVFNY